METKGAGGQDSTAASGPSAPSVHSQFKLIVVFFVYAHRHCCVAAATAIATVAAIVIVVTAGIIVVTAAIDILVAAVVVIVAATIVVVIAIVATTVAAAATAVIALPPLPLNIAISVVVVAIVHHQRGASPPLQSSRAPIARAWPQSESGKRHSHQLGKV